jgi:parvulin-like peptidyl-prolyl isomerase
MDKRLNRIKFSVTEAEIDHFAEFQGSTVKLTIFRATDDAAAKNSQFTHKESKTVPVQDLAGEISEHLDGLKVGERSAPICTESGCDIFQLDAITPSVSNPTQSGESRNKMRAMLLERKKQRVLDEWVTDLKAKADIKVLIK